MSFSNVKVWKSPGSVSRHLPMAAVAGSSGINVGLGSNVWLSFKLTQWNESPPQTDEQIVGKAGGRISVGSQSYDGETSRISGAFNADITAP